MPSIGLYQYELYRNEIGRATATSAFARERPEITAGGFCKTCNNGWTDRLDKDVEPWLTHALHAQRRVLTREFAKTPATWICKVGMVADTMLGQPTLSQDQRDYLYNHLEPPPGWRVWLGTAERGTEHRVGLGPWALVRPTGLGYMFTIVLDQFVAQALVLPREEDALTHPLEPRVVRQLWPIRMDANKIAWPEGTVPIPETSLDDFASWAAGVPMSAEDAPASIPLFP